MIITIKRAYEMSYWKEVLEKEEESWVLEEKIRAIFKRLVQEKTVILWKYSIELFERPNALVERLENWYWNVRVILTKNT